MAKSINKGAAPPDHPIFGGLRISGRAYSTITQATPETRRRQRLVARRLLRQRIVEQERTVENLIAQLRSETEHLRQLEHLLSQTFESPFEPRPDEEEKR